MEKNTEYRSAAWEAGEEEKIVGRAIVFEARATLYTDRETGLDYGEIIDRHALDGADLSDVVLRYDHAGRVLARTRNGSLKLTVGPGGLDIEADMSQSDEARGLYQDVKSGLVDKMSFAFIVAPEGDEWDAQTRTRRVTHIERVLDVSLVSFPAYEQTQVSARGRFEPLAEADRRAMEAAEAAEVRKIRGKADELIEKLKKMVRSSAWTKNEREIALRRRIDDLSHFWDNSNMEKRAAEENLEQLRMLEPEAWKIVEWRARLREELAAGGGRVIRTFGEEERKNMNDNNGVEIRAFQKYVSTGTTKNMTEEELRALNLSGAGAVLPTEIYNKIITSEKYSDLLHRATVINQSGAGKIYIPTITNTSADWHTENAATTGKEGTLGKLELGGWELLRTMTVSASVEAMSAGNFMETMGQVISAEVVEALEKSFISGTGTGQPKGLTGLTWTDDVNAVEDTALTAALVASGLSLLPQKYARNAIILCSAASAYQTFGLMKGTNEYAYNLAEGASSFMQKQIVISEHVPADTVFIVDPKELYVRFAAPLAVESDRSSGFMSASINLRALTVVDAAWNPAACVKVSKSAA